MASELVGKTAVPNVYIKKIELLDNTQNSYKASIQLEINDVQRGNNFQWSDDKFFVDYFKIALVMTSNNTMSNALRGGSLIPLPDNIKNSNFYNKETRIKIIPVSQFKMFFDVTSKKFKATCEYVLLNEIKNYDVYAIPYMDVNALNQKYKLSSTTGSEIYFGPVTSETIIKNSQIQNATTLFMKPNNTVYKGPVHIRDGSYFTGPKATIRPQAPLKAIIVENMKLIDSRTTVFGYRNSKSGPVKAIIGNLLQSIDGNIKFTGVFPIDMKALVLQKFKDSKKMINLGDALFEEFVSKIEIRSVNVIRQSVRTNRMSNRMGTPSIGIENTRNYKYLTDIKEVYLSSSPLIRHYQFADQGDDTDGVRYNYRCELLLIDFLPKFLEGKLSDLSTTYDNLVAIATDLRNRNNYNYRLKKLKIKAKIDPSLPDIVRKYYNTLSYFQEIATEQINKMSSNKMNLFLKATYNPENMDKFIFEFNSLIKQFKNYFSIRSLNSKRNYKKSYAQKNRLPPVINLSKQWPDIINYSDYRNSYDYLGLSNNGGFPTLSLSDLKARGDKEVSRFFKPGDSLTSEGMDNMSNETSANLRNITTSKDVYFAPLSFRTGKETTDLSDLEKINTKSLTERFYKARKEIDGKRKQSYGAKKRKKNQKPNREARRKGRFQRKKNKKNFDSAFSISRINPVMKINNLNPLSPMITSANYLGENSEFVDGVPNYDQVAPETDAFEVQNLLEGALKINTKRNKLNFDITANDNYVDGLRKNPKFTEEKIKKAPNHFKALVNSRSKGVKNNILSADVDVLKSPGTKVATEMTFQTTQKIEMIIGYKRDKNGLPIINVPIWAELDTSVIDEKATVMCRMKYTDQPEIGLTPNEEFKMPVQNSTFLLTRQDIGVNNKRIAKDYNPINLSKKQTFAEAIPYASSNVVIQNNSIKMLAGTRGFTGQRSTTSVGTAQSAPGGSNSGGY